MKLITKFKSWVSGILTKKLSDRTKRLILLASVAGRLVNKTQFENAAISKLNTTMRLCTPEKEGGLLVPIQISKLLWRGRFGEEVVFDADRDIVPEDAEKIIHAAPEWLRYNGDMQGDMQRLLSSKEELLATA